MNAELREAVEAVERQHDDNKGCYVVWPDEWQRLRKALRDQEAEIHRLQDSVNSLGLESAQHFVRAREWAERSGQQEARAEKAEALLQDLSVMLGPAAPECCNCDGCRREWNAALNCITAHLGGENNG